jgi:hypothetical protein
MEVSEVIRMKRNRARYLLVLAVLLLGAVLAWKLYGAKQAEDQQGLPQGLTSWEYLVVELLDTTWQTEINKLGSQGWELVSARMVFETYGARLRTLLERGVQPDVKYQCIFKRPRNS